MYRTDHEAVVVPTVPVTSYLRFLGNCRVDFPQNAARQNVDFLQPTTDRRRLREDFRSVDCIIPCSVFGVKTVVNRNVYLDRSAKD